MNSRKIEALKAWWLPLWHGPACQHGVHGNSYRDGIVLDCKNCMDAIHEEIRRESAERKAYELRFAFGPYLQELESRIAKLEARKKLPLKCPAPKCGNPYWNKPRKERAK